jgi:cysteine desulfurase/selenocysteine lyase
MTSTAVPPTSAAPAALDALAIRAQFPIIQTQVHGKPLVYLDNAATTQKPQVVLDRIMEYYTGMNANIHRGVHRLSEVSTAAHDKAREIVRRFLNARSTREVIFTRGCTEGINLVAQSWGRVHLKAGDEILITHLEHHSNIVPWQQLAQTTGARLVVVPITDAGEVTLESWKAAITPRTRVAAFSHVSNALGSVQDAQAMTAAVRAGGAADAIVVIDGAQAVPHLRVDVQQIDCDFYTFSGHKIYAPTGIGVLYGRERLLEAMTPWQGGGDMIASVSFEETTYNELPYKFEAGTPDIGGAIALGTALEWVESIGVENIAAHEADLVTYATEKLSEIPGVTIVGTAPHKAGVVSFTIQDIHPHDIGTLLDREGVAIRTGHHCAQPVMDRYDIPATARASFAPYNTREDVDKLVAAVKKTVEFFAGA